MQEKLNRNIYLFGEINEELIHNAIIQIHEIQQYDLSVLESKEVHYYTYEDFLRNEETNEIELDENEQEIKTLFESTVYGEEYLDYIEPIKIHICSTGGMINVGNSLLDCILTSKTPIHTIAYGECYSMALNLFIVGHKRFSNNRTRFMIHSCQGGTNGCYTNMSQQFEEVEITQQQFINDILEFSSFDSELLSKIVKEKLEYYFSAEDAIKYNIADEII
jgi:ATP-dependent protease ClpP protease subunit